MRLLHKLRPSTIQGYLMHMVLALLCIQVGVTWFLVTGLTSRILRNQIGQRALQTAKTISHMPAIRTLLLSRDPEGKIQKIAENIRKDIGARYVVVADATGKRYSHPVPERIGQHFVGGDIGPAIDEGKAYVSEAVGTLGPSLRGIVPIFSNNQVIGFVSVGYLTESVQHTISTNLNKPFIIIGILGGFNILCVLFISYRIKQFSLGLEPQKITQLYLQRAAVLATIREGVIAVDNRGIIQIVNPAAYTAIGLEPAVVLEDQHVDFLLPGTGLTEALRTGAPEKDVERTVNGSKLLMNIVPVYTGATSDSIAGAVASFRQRDEMQHVARELARVRKYTELLRAQAHEYSNTLHTISGLIQIEAYREALELVTSESASQTDFIYFLKEAVPHPTIAAIILGKFNRAKELKINFDIDRESSMKDVPQWINQETIITILGNLLDNAFETVLCKGAHGKQVYLSFTDLGNELVFEVEDAGPGIPTYILPTIFQRGVSTKDPCRGIGLSLVKERLEEMNGQITIAKSELGGTLFIIAIPKQRPYNC